MGLFGFGKKDKGDNITEALLQYVGGGLATPEDSFEGYVKSGYQKNLAVYSGVRYITRRAARIPVNVIRKKQDGTKEIVPDAPEMKLLNNPSDLMSYREFIEQALGFYLLTGNTFIYKLYSSTRAQSTPIQYHVLPTPFVDIEVESSSTGGRMKGVRLKTISTQQIPAENILHVRTPNYDYQNANWLYGQSPLKAALEVINAGNSIQKAISKLMQNLGAIGLLMYSAKENDKPSPDQSQIRQIQNFITKNISGAKNRGAIRGLSSVYKWQSLGMSANELKTLEQSKLTNRQIYGLFGLDSNLFNDHEQSTYNNMDEAKKSAYTEAIIPSLEVIIDKISKDLFKDRPDMELSLDLSGIEVLKKDIAKVIDALKDAYWVPTSVKQEMSGVEPDNVLPEYILPKSASSAGGVTDQETLDRLREIMDGGNE